MNGLNTWGIAPQTTTNRINLLSLLRLLKRIIPIIKGSNIIQIEIVPSIEIQSTYMIYKSVISMLVELSLSGPGNW